MSLYCASSTIRTVWSIWSTRWFMSASWSRSATRRLITATCSQDKEPLTATRRRSSQTHKWVVSCSISRARLRCRALQAACQAYNAHPKPTSACRRLVESGTLSPRTRTSPSVTVSLPKSKTALWSRRGIAGWICTKAEVVRPSMRHRWWLISRCRPRQTWPLWASTCLKRSRIRPTTR